MQRTGQLHQAAQRRFRQQEQKAKLQLKTPKPEAGKQRFQPESEIQGAVARPLPFSNSHRKNLKSSHWPLKV